MLDAYTPAASIDQVSSSFKDFDKKFCMASSCSAFSFAQEKMYHRPADDVIHKCNANGLWHESFAIKQTRFMLDPTGVESSGHSFLEAREQKEAESLEQKRNDMLWFTSPHDRAASSFHVAGHIPAYSKNNNDNTAQTMEVESTLSSTTSCSDGDSSWDTGISIAKALTVVIEFDEDKLTEDACNSSPEYDDGSSCGSEDEDDDDGAKFELFDDVSELTEDEGYDSGLDIDIEDGTSHVEEPFIDEIALDCDQAIDVDKEDPMSQLDEPSVNKGAKAIEDANLMQFLLSYCVVSDR